MTGGSGPALWWRASLISWRASALTPSCSSSELSALTQVPSAAMLAGSPTAGASRPGRAVSDRFRGRPLAARRRPTAAALLRLRRSVLESRLRCRWAAACWAEAAASPGRCSPLEPPRLCSGEVLDERLLSCSAALGCRGLFRAQLLSCWPLFRSLQFSWLLPCRAAPTPHLVSVHGSHSSRWSAAPPALQYRGQDHALPPLVSSGRF